MAVWRDRRYTRQRAVFGEETARSALLSRCCVYLTICTNPLENNLMLWKGERTSVTWIRNTPTPTRQWHDLKVRIAGTKVAGHLDGKQALPGACRAAAGLGRIGLWSKADNHVYFDDIIVTPDD
jgi:hypothetical protein